MGCACLTHNDINESIQIKYIDISNTLNNISSILNTNNDSSIESINELSFSQQKEENKKSFVKISKINQSNDVVSEDNILENNHIISTKITSPQKSGPILSMLKSMNTRKNKS